jgi:hypothetical protein
VKMLQNTSAELEVWLETRPQTAANKIVFSFAPLVRQRTLTRGRGAGAFPSPYSFPWSAGPKALTALILKTAIAHKRSQNEDLQVTLEGKRGSLAASLDYSISKKPNWILEMFSTDSHGRSLVHKFFQRTNPERKLGETVSICFNQKVFAPNSITIYVDGKLETSEQVLNSLLLSLEPAPEQESLLETDAASIPSYQPSTILKPSGFLNQIRTERYGYFAPGAIGSDALLEELYTTPGLRRITSHFYRPALTYCSTAMLRKMRVSEAVHSRNRHAIKLLQSGTLNSVEICPESSLLDIIRLKSNNAFKFYPAYLEAQDIIEYLDHIVSMLETYPNYNLFFTNANIPLQIATYDFEVDGQSERFTSYINRLKDDIRLDYECVVIYRSSDIPEQESDQLIHWIMTHMGTDRDKDSVIQKIKNVRAIIQSEGPLPPYEE